MPQRRPDGPAPGAIPPIVARIVRRCLETVPVVGIAVSLVFLATQWIPGDSVAELRAAGVDPQVVERIRALDADDRAALLRLVDWFSAPVRGDLGVSRSSMRPVSSLIATAIGRTLPLVALALVVQFGLGLALGLLACRRPGGAVDRAIVAAAAVLHSTPAFLSGLALMAVFAVGLGWLPASQMQSIDAGSLEPLARLGDRLRYLVLPMLALALPGVGAVCLLLREELRDRLPRDEPLILGCTVVATMTEPFPGAIECWVAAGQSQNFPGR